MFGLDGIDICLIIVFGMLFAAILSGFPVAFAIGGAAVISFAVIAGLDSAGLLHHQTIDTGSAEYAALIGEGIRMDAISVFTYPDLPRIAVPVFERGWEMALDRNVAFIVNRMNERVFAGQSIDTLLAVLMFVMMGIMLERSRIADELLTKMASVFGHLPGGLAVSVVVVGAFLAASTGIVGATVVTMGLLALPTMLRNNYSPELATGVIAASGTLGQIIPPSIVIVLLGTLASDLYAPAQEARANLAGCGDALTYLGKPAVVSVGTLFQAAMLPGILLAVLYGLYAFGFALLNPSKAPAVPFIGGQLSLTTRNEKLVWYGAVPALLVGAMVLFTQVGLIGSQSIIVDSYSDAGQTASLRTNVSADCQASIIALHGQEAWDKAVAEQAEIDAAGGVAQSRQLSDEERATLRAGMVADAAPIGTGIAIFVLFFGLILGMARGVDTLADPRPLLIGVGALLAILAVDALWLDPLSTPGAVTAALALPALALFWSVRVAAKRLAGNEIVKVIFPPLVLIVAVLGSIMGGVTNPTPAAALGAGGAILLAAARHLVERGRSPRLIIRAALAIALMLMIGFNFDLRLGPDMAAENMLAFLVAFLAFLYAMFGIFYSCWLLFSDGILTSVVRDTAKVTSMVFTILIGSQMLNLVLISFGGEHYIQDFLRSFSNEWTTFLIVMLLLFILGFVLDFLEIIYIVIPIVGPVIYGGSFDPKWVTIMIAVNLQTSFLTPPFGFALFYLRGVAPPEVTTGQIYRGIVPFVLIQILGLVLLALVPGFVTILPNLLGQ
ncbi:MAG: TRAP transporter large permease subunit [Paracoccaceae bacterium]